MNKIVLTLGVIIGLGVLPLFSQDTQAARTDSILFEKLVHDYGTIKQGSDGSFEFKYSNKGSAPLVLTEVRSSCGCTVAEWPREPLAPGKEGVIKVNYNTKILGNFSKPVTVYSNASNNPVVLRVKGNVIP